jgi:hypothetical protein
MRLSEFWDRMETRFGAGYAHSLAKDYRMPLLGGSVDDAIARGDAPKAIWRAVCAEFEMPAALR